jgi:DNA polymerase-3 subunit gamma/tau
MVTREGFNALLKLVEEPPPHLKFVFATTEPEKVIATIRSRTHHYPFRLVPPAVLRELLEQILAAEGVSFDPAVLPLVVRAGAGSVRDSLSVLDQLVAGSAEAGLTYERTVALLGYTDDSLLDETVDAFAAGEGAAVFGTVGRVMEGGHDPRRFAADLLDRLRDLIVLAAVPGAGETGLLDVPADRLERMSEQAGRLGQAELTRAAAIISDGLIQMRGATAPRLLLELMCAQVLLPSASTGEKALLARVERLERRLEQPGREQPGPGPADDRPAAGGRRPAGGKQAAAREEPAPPAARKAARPAGADTGRGNRPADPGPPPAAREAAQPPAGEAGRKQGSQPPAAEAGGEPDRPPPAQRPAGPVDADAVRQRWPEILDAVKGERRVAWILLSNASVHTVEDGVLTVGFAREGEAKGFAASGYDKDLMRVLRERLGTPLKVKTIAGVLPGGRPPEGPPPGRQETGPARASGTGPGGPPAGQDAGPGPAAQAAPPPPAGRSRQARQQRQAPSQARPSADEEWPQEPDDAAGAQAPGAGLSGMDLIRQQLGGQIIEELED